MSDKASKNDKEKSKENVTGSCLWVKPSPFFSAEFRRKKLEENDSFEYAS